MSYSYGVQEEILPRMSVFHEMFLAPPLFFILEFKHKIDKKKVVFSNAFKKVLWRIHNNNKPLKPDPILLAHFLKSE